MRGGGVTEKTLKPLVIQDSDGLLIIEWAFGPVRFGIWQEAIGKPDTWHLIVKPDFEAWAGELPKGCINWDKVRAISRFRFV